LKSIAVDELKLEVSVVDRDLGVFSSEKLEIPLFADTAARPVTALSAAFQTTSHAKLLAQPDADAELVGHLSQGLSFNATAKVGEYLRVALGGERFAFLAQTDTKAGSGKVTLPPAWTPVLSRSPPRLSAKTKDLATRGDTMSLEMSASDENGGVQDAFVFVGNRKVFYKPNPSKDGAAMQFTIDVPLKAGVNVITVVARENEDVSTSRRLVVRKDGPNGEILPTPKDDVFGEDWEFAEP
jgi:carboxyl-terminal processing protease